MNKDLDYILGLKDMPMCLGFGAFSTHPDYACLGYVKGGDEKCLECQQISKHFPNMWRGFDERRINYIKRGSRKHEDI